MFFMRIKKAREHSQSVLKGVVSPLDSAHLSLGMQC